jgi:hypothetical protein
MQSDKELTITLVSFDRIYCMPVLSSHSTKGLVQKSTYKSAQHVVPRTILLSAMKSMQWGLEPRYAYNECASTQELIMSSCSTRCFHMYGVNCVPYTSHSTSSLNQ